MLAVLIIPFMVLSFFTFPSADDFSISFLAREAGFWNYQHLMYDTWTGRYAANFIEAINPLVWGWEWGYRLIPIIMMIMMVFSIYILLRFLIKYNFTRMEILAGTLIIFTLYLNIFPGISEGLYWMTGAIEYLFANILMMLLIPAFEWIRVDGLRFYQRLIFYLISVFLAFVICGLNEISILLLFEFIALRILWKYSLTRRIDLTATGLLLIVVGAGLIEVSAPGNFDRMSEFSGNFNFFATLSGSIKSVTKLVGIFLQNPPFLILTLLFIPYSVRKPIENTPLWHLSRLKPIWVLFISIFVIFSLYIPPFLGMGINPPLRVHALIALVFLWLWGINIYSLMQYIRRKGIDKIALPSWASYFLVIVAVILTLTDFNKIPSGPVYFRGNIVRAWSDLALRASNYNKQMNDRILFIDKVKENGMDTIEFCRLKDVPQTIYFIDISEDPAHWINYSFSRYYNTCPVRLADDNNGYKKMKL